MRDLPGGALGDDVSGRGAVAGCGGPLGTIVRDIGGDDGVARGTAAPGGVNCVRVGAPAGAGAICVCIDAPPAGGAIIVCACVPAGACAIDVCACESPNCAASGAATSAPGIVAASSVRAERGS